MVDNILGEVRSLHLYRSERTHRHLNDEDRRIRQTAAALVAKDFHSMVIEHVAEAMNDFLGRTYGLPINLVPVPDSRGMTSRNLALSSRICEAFGEGIHVRDILEGDPHQSMCERHRAEIKPLQPEALKIRVKKSRRSGKLVNPVLIDNVLTSGTTFLACVGAIERVGIEVWPAVDILVWADARETIHHLYRRV